MRDQISHDIVGQVTPSRLDQVPTLNDGSTNSQSVELINDLQVVLRTERAPNDAGQALGLFSEPVREVVS